MAEEDAEPAAVEQAWGVTMFRDEVDVAADVITHMVDEGLNGIIVADNGSVDGTKEAVLELVEWAERKGCCLIVQDDMERGYYQSRKMSALAAQAAAEGATWIVPFDADEVWFSHDDRIGHILRRQHHEVYVMRARLFHHFTTVLDPPDGSPFVAIGWRQRKPAPLHKVAFRWQEGAVVLQGNHGVRYPDCDKLTVDGLEVRHFPYRSIEQFRRKAINGAEAYKATDLPESEGAHWRQYGALLEQFGPGALDEVWERYYHFLAPVEEGMVHDPAPWCRWRRGV